MRFRLTRNETLALATLLVLILGAIGYRQYLGDSGAAPTAEEELRLNWENENCDPIYQKHDGDGGYDFMGMKCPPGGPPDPWGGTGKKHPPPSAD